ncbi:MAG TPA: response regulator transcription factor [Kofleriaceae bacterium]|nr:response regulator transcription factor [Kofleriaceae bacterium]
MIEVAIVDDDVVLREGLAQLIGDEADLTCLQRHGSVEAALAASPKRSPDVVLLDIHLPGMLGSEGVARLCTKYPRAAVLMLSVYDAQDKVFESICNGACGYLLKRTPPARIVEAIRDAHAGGAPMSPEIASQVIGVFRQTRAPAAAAHVLTPKEVELLALLADGHSYLNAANTLEISINTVRNHVRSIYDKLHVHTKSEAVAKALKQGILR